MHNGCMSFLCVLWNLSEKTNGRCFSKHGLPGGCDHQCFGESMCGSSAVVKVFPGNQSSPPNFLQILRGKELKMFLRLLSGHNIKCQEMQLFSPAKSKLNLEIISESSEPQHRSFLKNIFFKY